MISITQKIFKSLAIQNNLPFCCWTLLPLATCPEREKPQRQCKQFKQTAIAAKCLE